MYRELSPSQVLRMWTSETTLKLIEDLHSLPCLWDVQSAEYKNRNKKVDAYDTLASKYCVSVMQVEKKIQALKTQFRREHRKLVTKRSGSSPKKAAWFGYEQLLFLLQGNESRSRSTDNTDVQDGEESAPPLSDSEIDGDFQTNSHEREEKTDKTSNFRIPAPKRSKKIANEDGSVQEALQCMKTLTERVSKRDDYSVYGEHVGNKLRSCGRSSFEISIAQHHIDEVLFNLTMGAYGRHPYSSTYSTQHTHPALTIPAGHQNYHYSNPSSSSSSPSPSSPSSHQSNSVLPTSAVPPSSNTPYQYQSAKENNNSHP